MAETDGRRMREIREWRGMSLKAVAGLAGISYSYLGKLERGEKEVNNRQTLEGIARALRVSPTELTDQPHTGDPRMAETHAVVRGVEEALNEVELGERPEGITPRPWPALLAVLDHLNTKLRPEADYAAQGKILPTLLYELYASYLAADVPRRDVLVAIVQVQHAAAVLTKNLSARGVPVLAAHHAKAAARELGDPVWLGLVAWLRGHAAGSANRAGQYSKSVRAADDLVGHLDDPDAAQVYGMLHLNAALAKAAQKEASDAETHLAEAQTIADRLDFEVGSFGSLYFGRPNVGIWRVGLATELMASGGKVAELARGVRPELVPSAARQGMFYADLGRALVRERRTHSEGVAALLRAEQLAPQRVLNNVFVRTAVSELASKVKRDALGRELRGLAWRMGLPPKG